MCIDNEGHCAFTGCFSSMPFSLKLKHPQPHTPWAPAPSVPLSLKLKHPQAQPHTSWAPRFLKGKKLRLKEPINASAQYLSKYLIYQTCVLSSTSCGDSYSNVLQRELSLKPQMIDVRLHFKIYWNKMFIYGLGNIVVFDWTTLWTETYLYIPSDVGAGRLNSADADLIGPLLESQVMMMMNYLQ